MTTGTCWLHYDDFVVYFSTGPQFCNERWCVPIYWTKIKDEMQKGIGSLYPTIPITKHFFLKVSNVLQASLVDWREGEGVFWAQN